MADQAIGFIGVGRMGGPMARRLIAAGYKLTVYDTNDAAVAPLVALGAVTPARSHRSPRRRRRCFASLPTPESCRPSRRRWRPAIACGPSSISRPPDRAWRPKSARSLAASGITAVDCPVSGGVIGAEKGTLAVVVPGPQKSTTG